jgi:hypothetical protein
MERLELSLFPFLSVAQIDLDRIPASVSFTKDTLVLLSNPELEAVRLLVQFCEEAKFARIAIISRKASKYASLAESGFVLGVF